MEYIAFAKELLAKENRGNIVMEVFDRFSVNCINSRTLDSQKLDALIEEFDQSNGDLDLLVKIIETVHAEETRGYKPLALYSDVQFFVRQGEKTKVGIYLPYSAITAIAPYAAFDAAADLYVATYGADADTNKEYTPTLCGMTVRWKKPSTYPILAADSTLKAR